MNLKTDDKMIGDFKVTVRQFPAMRAFALLTRLLETIGPALGELAALDPNTQLDLAGAAFANVFAKLDSKKAVELVPEILAGTAVLVPDDKGGREYSLQKRENIDIVFSGHLAALFQSIAFAVQVNFGDFMQGSGAASAAPRGGAAEAA